MASVFTRKFQNDLRAELKRILKNYEVIGGEYWLKAEGKRLIPVDIALRSRDRLVVIEIESHRQDPSNNIAKIPFWIDQDHTNQKLSLFQLFSPFYSKHKTKRQISEKLGSIIVQRHRGNLTYNSLDFQPMMTFTEFEAVYHNPFGNKLVLKDIVNSTAKYIRELL